MEAHKLLKIAYKEFCSRDIGNQNLNKISRVTNLPYSTVYNAINNKHRINAETWITLMRYFDAVIIK